MEKWPEAEEYAKKAQEGYTMMTEAEYLDHDKGFNTPNNSWMFMTKYDAEDPNITLNDGDSSWGSQMMIEITIKQSCQTTRKGSPEPKSSRAGNGTEPTC